MNEKIFISYSRRDKEKVFAIRDEIEREVHTKCWIDLNGIESDQQFSDVILNAIKQTDVFLFMYSPNAAQSDWTKKELNFANKKKKRIVFVNLDGSELEDWFELNFGLNDIIDINVAEQKNKMFRNLQDWCGDSQIDMAKEKLQTLSKEYPSIVAKNTTYSNEIISNLHKLGVAFRLCPVCGNQINIEKTICSVCNWRLSPLTGIENTEYLQRADLEYFSQIKVARKNWEERTSEINSINSAFNSVKADYEALKKKYDDKVEELVNADSQLSNVLKELNSCRAKLDGVSKAQTSNTGNDKIQTNSNDPVSKVVEPWGGFFSRFLFGSDTSSAVSSVTSTDDTIEAKILEVIRNCCKRPDSKCSITPLQSSALDTDKLRQKLKKQYNFTLDRSVINTSKTLGDLAHKICKMLPQ